MRFLPVSLALLSLAACGGSSSTQKADGGSPSVDAGHATDVSFIAVDASHEANAPTKDAGHTGEDAPTAADTGMTADTGTPAMRNASCTPLSAQTGTDINTAHGRLDGTLVFVVDEGTGKNCNGDDSHVHLQIEVSGSVYDVAVDIGTAPSDEVGMYEETMAVPGGAWAEGWHDDTLAYPSIGVHSTSFVTMAPNAMASQVESLLATTSKISIFCTVYSTDNGCHDVHYENGSGKDGAIVLDPTAAMSPVLFFRFTTDSF